MKIRFKGNSLRYRLTRTDVAQLTTAGYIYDKVDFGDHSLTYSIKRMEGGIGYQPPSKIMLLPYLCLQV
jgi:hypothetical protein